MSKDLNKWISNISYNSLNLPISLVIANSLGTATNNYTYSANGEKLKVGMKFGNQIKTTDYVDNMIYENDALKHILVDGGYVENGQYHFYIQDYLGNNRVVAKSDGRVIQTNHYYPFGITFMEDGTHKCFIITDGSTDTWRIFSNEVQILSVSPILDDLLNKEYQKTFEKI